MARVDISKKYDFIDKEGLRAEVMPAILIYFEGEYFIFDGNRTTPTEILHLINKIINPIVTLSTDEEI